MARLRTWVVLSSLLAAATPASALDPGRPLDLFFHQSWQMRDGLPQNTIEAILQTRDGHLWLATQEGLVRFDGARFAVFDRQTSGMTTNHVTTLLEARDGTLWVGTLGGGLLRWQGGQATALAPGRGPSSDSVTALAEDAAGRIWIGTQDHGIDVLEAGRVREGVVPGLPSPQIRALAVGADGALWAGTANGLARIEDGQVQVFTAGDGLGSDSITALAHDARGLWVGTAAGVAFRGLGTSGFRTLTRRDGLTHDAVRSLHVDADGCVWIGTASGGLNRWHAGALSAFTSSHGLTSDAVLAVYTSRDGSLWIGTDGGGLNRLRQGRLSEFGPRQGLASRDVYTVAGSRGGVLAGSYQGDVDLLRGTRFQRRVPGRLIGSARVRALLEDAAGALWIGTDDGLWRAADGAPARVTVRQGAAGAVRALAQDAAGTIWVGTDGAGLFRVEDEDVLVPAAPALRTAQVRAILPDARRGLWLGTYGGLALLREGGAITRFTTADGLPHDYVRSLHLSADGTLWIGTYGGGLSRHRDGRFVNYGVAEGLFSDVIYSILEDGAGDLWMSCNRGIFRVGRRDLEEVAAGRRQRIVSHRFDEADGMTNRECNGGSPAAWRTPDGRLWFATLGGVVMVDPAHMAAREAPPPVLIDRVVADGVEVADRAAAPLASRPRRLELHYAALSFVAPEKVRYRYRLEGYDRDWVEAGSNRTAQYTRLPPGRYRFQVSARNDDGPWNDTADSWEFRLAPALHETPWLYAAAALLLGGAGFGLHRWRVHSLRRHEQRLQERIQDALAQIKVLSGLIPICSGCKKIRDDDGYWEQMEVYIREHSQAQFSHGLCPGCIREMYPEYADAVLAAASPAKR